MSSVGKNSHAVGMFICAVLVMMVAFQSVIMLMRWPRAHDTDELRRNSVSSVVSCFIPREWARQNACGKQKKQPPSRSQDQKHYDVALAMLVDDFLGAEARAATIQNKVEYCKRWGYDMVAPGVKEAVKLSGGHPFPWGKFRMLQTVLSKHEFAFMIDADAMIINMEYDISELLQSMIASNSFMLISEDFNGVNSGVFILRRCAMAFQFLEEAIKSAEILAENQYLPLRYENRAFFYLLDSWPVCFGMRRVDSILAPIFNATLSALFVQGTKIVDRCLINVHPSSSITGITSSAMSYDYSDDNTFILHAAGGDAESKLQFFSRFLLAGKDHKQ